ncbi:MAG TPA: DUF433 domain-containing protein [Blastocatellia bacterium]|nr:DUF433 domain-containing protein [Blastocatellia bacterium]
MGAVEHIVADVPIHNQPPQPEPESKPPITRNPERMSGAPTIAGTRLPVTTLIDYLSDGYTVAEFLDDFEGAVTAEQVEAVLMKIRDALEEGWLAEDVDY